MKAEWTNNDSLTTSQTTKATLVIDKSESCTSCMLGIYNKRWFCLATNEDINITDRYNIPEWCPLKPMPEKLQFQEPFNDDYTVSWASRLGFVDGWNACIEEIEK